MTRSATLVQLWALAAIVVIGLVCSLLVIPEGLARQSLVVCGITGACVAAAHGIVSAARSGQLVGLALALCSWATGWILWPFWINGKHRLPDELRVFAEFPAEAVAPGIWMHKLWISTGLVGGWACVIASSAAVLATMGLALRGRTRPAVDWIGVGALSVFWLALGATLAHALSWMLD